MQKHEQLRQSNFKHGVSQHRYNSLENLSEETKPFCF